MEGGMLRRADFLIPALSIAAVALMCLARADAAEYVLMPSARTVHIGYFSAELPPVLRIASGDIVTIETASMLTAQEIEASGIVPASAIPPYQAEIFRGVKDRGPGPHVLTGPIAIRDAMPGDMLEIRLLSIELAHDFGHNTQIPIAGTIPEDFPNRWRRVVLIDRQAKTAAIAQGVILRLDRPFFGTMGVAQPRAAGRISSGPPGVHGGNLDNKDLVAGTTLFIPVRVAGALFSVGDGHAAQEHGEVDVSAIETGLRGRFQFFLHKNVALAWPRAETPTHWIVMGLHEDLDEALKIAVRETIDFITKRFPRLTREEAYMIASTAVDYHVTQAVDGTKGIHGMIPKEIFVGDESGRGTRHGRDVP